MSEIWSRRCASMPNFVVLLTSSISKWPAATHRNFGSFRLFVVPHFNPSHHLRLAPRKRKPIFTRVDRSGICPRESMSVISGIGMGIRALYDAASVIMLLWWFYSFIMFLWWLLKVVWQLLKAVWLLLKAVTSYARGFVENSKPNGAGHF